MRQIVVSTTAVESSDPVVLDPYISPFQVSIGVAMDAGSEIAVEHTFSNVLDSTVTPVWYATFSSAADEGYLLQENGSAILQENDSYILTGDYNVSHYIDFPVSALRLNTIQNTGTVTMTVLQAGMPGR
jgi:hypothetical protein